MSRLHVYTPPTERLALSTAGGLMFGAVAATACGGSWGQIVLGGLVGAAAVGSAMVLKLALEARQRRHLRVVVRPPMVHFENVVLLDRERTAK